MSDRDDPTESPGSPSETTAQENQSGSNAADDASATGTSAEGDTDASATVEGADESTAAAEASMAASIEDIEEMLDEESVGERRRLDPKVRLYWVASRVFTTVVTTVIVGLLFQYVGGAVGLVDTPGSLPFDFAVRTVLVAAGVFAFIGGVTVLHAVLYYRSWRYEVREDSLYLTRGVLTRVQTVAPYVRVQHIDARRGPIERLLGLSTLVVYTAGSRGADVTIPGLTDERADELQTALKRLAIASEEEDAV